MFPEQNSNITKDDQEPSNASSQSLSELWGWLYHSHEILCNPTSRLHGYDFSYHGLAGIWEGFPPIAAPAQQQQVVDDTPIPIPRTLLDVPPANALAQGQHHAHASSGGGTRRSRSPADDLHGNWPAALAILAARKGADRSSWKPTVPTTKLVQRQIALQICGWSLREDELAAAVKRWEKDDQLSRAACWLVFTRQYSKAVELLMRSNDETHQMMSGTVAALAPLMSSSGSARALDLRELYGRLIIKLNDPYFRVMLTHLATGDWSEVLDEEVIPFHERLAIAFQFLDDKALSSYLRRTTERACDEGNIDALIVTGLTPAGMRVIQSYVDHTGDIQSAAILSSYVCPQKFKDRRAERWLEAYRDLLDGFKMHHLRVGFDIERGQILHDAMQNGDMLPEEWAPRQIVMRCHYCNKPFSDMTILLAPQPQRERPTVCSGCKRELPRCSVCLMTLSIVHDAAREVELGYSHQRDTFDDAIVICQTCRHGGHAVHILEWFLGEDGRRTHDNPSASLILGNIIPHPREKDKMSFVNAHTPPNERDIDISFKDPYDLNSTIPVPPILQSDRVCLVPFIPSIHAEAFHTAYLADAESIGRYLPVNWSTIDAFLAFLESFIRQDPTSVLFIIIDKTRPSENPTLIPARMRSRSNWVGPRLARSALDGVRPSCCPARIPAHVRLCQRRRAFAEVRLGYIGGRWAGFPSCGMVREPGECCESQRGGKMGFTKEGVVRWSWVLPEGKKGKKAEEGRGKGDGRDSVLLSICWDDWVSGVRDLVVKRMNRA
ncbi:hypothetical protein NLJ89_g9102 [Agrocybe chaxingu]|uniref:Uncharacterized protein n=1 Tax=Agrocybe chaxingu TaxID=84603 RepID=A0A9W8JT34_9AGAR|nr:hypothetical protein NLJ89_g9102 [Agrocybe chaxingu]